MSQIIAISGSTGLIGRRLISHYQGLGWEVIPLKRGDFSMDSVSLAARLKGAHAVVNLAGAPIAQRWTLKGRKVIMDSRINTTRSLVEAIGKMSEPPSVLLNASAIGIYPDTGDHTEDSIGRDHSFMGQVCEAWEKEAEVVRDGTRLVLLRFGVVLDADGGALARLLPFFRMGVGGRVGSGDQAFSWIHSTDLVRAISFLHLGSKVNGPVNMVAPVPSTNREFT
ncbi:MAG: TIGR01777 family protein, partial [Bacteroidales bacterium]|nr:TIGR01777 family protein [Bacteroidales bacterium]